MCVEQGDGVRVREGEGNGVSAEAVQGHAAAARERRAAAEEARRRLPQAGACQGQEKMITACCIMLV